MGKGDKKTKRGKILMGSYGVRRARKKLVRTVPLETLKEEAPVRVPKEKATAKPKALVEEGKSEVVDAAVAVEEVAKPAKKKAPPKASKKEEKAEE